RGKPTQPARAPATPKIAHAPNSTSGPEPAYRTPPTTFAMNAAMPAVVIEIRAWPLPWSRDGRSVWIAITLAIHSPENPAPEISRDAMIAAGVASTAHSTKATAYL